MQVFGALSCVDRGDSPTVPGYIEDTLERITDYVRPSPRPGVIGLGMGGDHSVTLGELRAYAAVHGPLGSCSSTRTPTSGTATSAGPTTTEPSSGAR